MRRKLPIGIQTLRTIREEGYYYVDKTPGIERLLREGKHYFLSRPRRFGKSLLLDTLKELFEGNEALFRGLHIHRRRDWQRRHPVLRLSFGGAGFRAQADLGVNLGEQLRDLEIDMGVEPRHASMSGRFRHLVRSLHRSHGERVVVLVDEYDKPILDALVAGKSGLARDNRDALRSLYGNIREADADIRFSLLTGVSKFTKASLFPELNNLLDITLDPQYATICGYRESDLDTVFAPELDGLNRETIRDWYSGYCWPGGEKVYNPFDILLVFSQRRFSAHWFETGSPAFLLETLRERGVGPLDLDDMIASDDLLSAFDVDHMTTEALLFQTGYLTIVGEQREEDETLYRLGYPNREVRQSLNRSLLRAIGWTPHKQLRQRSDLRRSLQRADFASLERHFRGLFASIPYNWHTGNDIARYEGYWASVMYGSFHALGLDVTVEDASAAGCLDMAVRAYGQLYLFEFKVTEQAGRGAALKQLEARGYAHKYVGRGEPVHLVGVEFSGEQRRLERFDVLRAAAAG